MHSSWKIDQSFEKKINSDVPKIEDEGDTDVGQISTKNNHIYFYSDVDQRSVLDLTKQLNEKSFELLDMKNRLGIEVPIILHIFSPGGLAFAGFSAYDTILKNKVPVYTVVDGFAASAATLLLIAGTKRFINPHSYTLVHQLRSASWGTFQKLEDDHTNNKRLMKMIKEIYLERTKLPVKKIDEILKHDLYFDAKQTLKYGLVDEIIK